MKKVAFVFILAVFVPSLALAWLALRSLSDQKIIFERQQTLLYQGACSSVVKDILDFVSERQNEFGRHVEASLAARAAHEVAANFDETILQLWPMAEVGFAVSLQGNILSPPLLARPQTKRFRLENDLFLSNQESVEVYWNSPKGMIPLSKPSDTSVDREADDAKDASKSPSGKGAEKLRKISPQKDGNPEDKAVSKVTASEAEFRQLISDGTQGVIGRFLQNRLKLLFWYRSPRTPDTVFGAQVKLPALIEGLRGVVKVDRSLENDICVAILEDTGKPVARSLGAFTTDWKRPFVSLEIGEVLPHWEVAAYLLNPDQLSRTEKTLALLLGLFVALLVSAIGVGGWLIFADLGRQLTLARQKTDFVSNVSHELKTPLTSIRMFSELLAENRVTDEAKRQMYLSIITTEVARLTRLINNVLDFARIERGEKRYQFEPCDVIRIVRDTVESYRPQLESGGFQLNCALPAAPAVANGDRDALAQVVLNLLSNAEKYSGDQKEIAVTASVIQQADASIEVKVLDRGMGVPRGCEEKIFEQFFRAHDSLSSGIQGSGLGLTLARETARAHGGEVTFQPREGGGSCFTLRLPLTIAP